MPFCFAPGKRGLSLFCSFFIEAGAGHKPNSVPAECRRWLFILPLDCSRGLATYPPPETGHLNQGQFGLAPDGVYHASDVTTRTVSSYLTFSPLLCPTVGTGCSKRCLFCGTFLRSLGVAVSDHPALWSSDFPPPLPSDGKKEQPPRLLQPLFLFHIVRAFYIGYSAVCRSPWPSVKCSSCSFRV